MIDGKMYFRRRTKVFMMKRDNALFMTRVEEGVIFGSLSNEGYAVCEKGVTYNKLHGL